MNGALLNPSRWRIVTLRLSEDAKPVVSYNLRTANDCAPRNPNAWVLEASDDGVHWRIVSEKTNVVVPGDKEWFVWYNGGNSYAFDDRADSRLYAVSAGATLDLGGGLLSCGKLTGSGTVTGGSVRASDGVADSLTLADVELRGDTQIVGDETIVPDAAFWSAHPAVLAAAGGDVAAAAKMQSPGKSGKGKFKANGEPMYVWEDFVAGTNPEDETDLFRAEIVMDADGKPQIRWTHPLNGTDANGDCIKTGVRTYRVWGKVELGDHSGANDGWFDADVTPGDYKFFRVTVEMP